MTLKDATKIAEVTCMLLESACEKIVIAGSIRRQRPECNVDLVALPKWKEHLDLLGNVESRENLLRTLLIDYVRSNRQKVSWIKGVEPKPDAENMILQGAKAQVDIFIATPATWTTRLITRTGSKEHNIWIANRANALHGSFRPQEGLWFPDRGLVRPQSEEEFYEALGLPFIEPVNREVAFLARLEKELACR